MKHKNLLIDVNNVVWKIRYLQKLSKTKKESHVTQLIFLKTLEEMNRYFKYFQGQGVLCAFEGKGNWRRSHYSDYKNRENDDLYYGDIQEAIKLLKKFLKEYTSVKVVSVEKAEADDVIAVACQEKDKDIHNVILSSDKDFVQLLVNPNVTLYSSQKDEQRDTPDPEYDLFLKCIRGDPSDNIYSAYPRVRKTKIEEAFYGDSMGHMNFMETVNKDGSKVGDRFNENSLMIDLRKQPQSLRDAIETELNDPTVGSYSQVEVMKFAKENSVTKLGELAMKGEFTQMFRSTFNLH